MTYGTHGVTEPKAPVAPHILDANAVAGLLQVHADFPSLLHRLADIPNWCTARAR